MAIIEVAILGGCDARDLAGLCGRDGELGCLVACGSATSSEY